MSNQFKRVPTCGENDVDLRVATEPRRAADRLTASVQFHELAQGYRAATADGAQAAYERLCAFLEQRESSVHATIIAAKYGEIAALTAEVTHLAEKLAGSVYRNRVLEEVARHFDKKSRMCNPAFVAEFVRDMKSAPQLVDAAIVLCGQCRGVGGRGFDRCAACNGTGYEPVDAAQAVPQLQRQAVAVVVSRFGDDLRVGWLRPERCSVGTLLFCAVEPTDTTKGA